MSDGSYSLDISSSGESSSSWISEVWNIVEGILGWFAYDTASDQQAREARYAREEDKRRYDEQMRLWKKQNKFENMLKLEQSQLAWDTFNWGRSKWGKEFNIEKDKYLTQRKNLAIESRRSGLDRMVGGLMNSYGLQEANMSQLIQRMGV